MKKLSQTHFINWLEQLKTAWEERNPELAVQLFSDDAEYFTAPGETPAVGKEGVAAIWNQVPLYQANIQFAYELIAVKSLRGYCKWQVSYDQLYNGGRRVHLDGIFEIRFNQQGEAALLRMWYHQRAEEKVLDAAI